MSRSSVGSSSELNSPVSFFAATDNTQKENREEPDIEGSVDKSCDSQRDFATGSIGVSRNIHQLCVIITEAAEENDHAEMEETMRKSTNQRATVGRRRKKFMSPSGSGKSSCQPSTTARKYLPIQEEKF
jgi:hypothetical protein